MSEPSPRQQGAPHSYEEMQRAHPCHIPNTAKSMSSTLMEDGSVCLAIFHARTPGDLSAVEILEYVVLKRQDFNRWLYDQRQWWEQEKRHPTVRQTRMVSVKDLPALGAGQTGPSTTDRPPQG